jgi:hypothetical protein
MPPLRERRRLLAVERESALTEAVGEGPLSFALFQRTVYDP